MTADTTIIICPICQKAKEKLRYNAIYCGPTCQKVAERRRRKQIMAEERHGARGAALVTQRGVQVGATFAELSTTEAQLIAAKRTDFREFNNPDPSWQPSDPRITWAQNQETKTWGMIFNANDAPALPTLSSETKARVAVEEFYKKPTGATEDDDEILTID